VSVRRSELLLAAMVALVFGTAPTVGDVGSCGRTATDLDRRSFAEARKTVDCQRCTDCGLTTQRCHAACDPQAASDVSWPSTCYPLEHDGEVCLRALQAASCGDYAGFVDDRAPSAPTECDFCHGGSGSGGPSAGSP
jgi:hypothetical protein